MAKMSKKRISNAINEAVRQSIQKIKEGNGDVWTANSDGSVVEASWRTMAEWFDNEDEGYIGFFDHLDTVAPLSFDVEYDYKPGIEDTYDTPGIASSLSISSAKVSKDTINQLVSFLQSENFAPWVENSMREMDLDDIRERYYED